MKKRLIGIVLVAVMLLGLFCGCAKDDGTVTLTFLRLGNDEAEKNFWLEVIESYEAANPGIKIEYDDAAIGNAMDTKLTSLFSSNSGPDIIGHGILSIASRVEAGHYLPLDEYMQTWEQADDMIDMLQDFATYEGHTYGVAYMPTSYVFAYRTDLFAQAGIDAPPTTWEELLDYAERLTVVENGHTVQAGFAFPTAGGNLVEYDILSFCNGGRFADENGNPTINTPENLEALEFMSRLNEYSIPYNSNETNPFMTGNAAMTFIDNVKLSPMFSDPEYADKIALAMPPANGDNPAMTFSGCRLLFVGKDCKNVKEAFDFITYAVSEAIVMKRAQDTDAQAVLKSVSDEYATLKPFNDIRIKYVENGIGMPVTTWSTMFQTVRNEMVQAVQNGADPATALAQAQTKLEQEIANAK
ncbi:MAG: sugar ABC transporter substrate-binding protein [Clostridia bacterium]|nr:sugar ABC transporter substrate-binding protein [Clostridia bacterium]